MKTEKNQRSRSWFFGKTHRIDKCLARWSRKGKQHKLQYRGVQRASIITNPTNFQRWCKNFKSNFMPTHWKIQINGKTPRTPRLRKPGQEERANPSGPAAIRRIKRKREPANSGVSRPCERRRRSLPNAYVVIGPRRTQTLPGKKEGLPPTVFPEAGSTLNSNRDPPRRARSDSRGHKAPGSESPSGFRRWMW